MRLGVIAESLIERAALALGLVPVPVLDTMVALLLARTVIAGTKLGVFDALERQSLSPGEVAARCGADPEAMDKMLFALVGAGYLRWGDGAYSLAPMARRWMLASGSRSMRDAVLQREMDGRLMEHFEEFVRTGQPLDFHHTMSPEEWDVYVRGQRAHAVYAAPEVSRRAPVPRGARAMLDIGGSHGYFSVAICRSRPGLSSTVLDLPDAIRHAAPVLAQEGMGDRVRHRAGNALTDDLGDREYDLIFYANLAHHFGDWANRDLARRCHRALRPGGCLVIADLIRSPTPERAGQIGALTHLYFAATSLSGTWSFEEMAGWQRDAGLIPFRPIRLRSSPGYGLQTARRRA